MLLGKNFDDIDQATVQELVDAGATESVHLDFKRETYGNSDKDKKEFLKDISSLANTLGGYLLIGMDEEEGAAAAVTPLTGNVDEELRRLESIAETGVEPKIIGLRIRRVQIGDGDVIVIHVPRSFNPPHRVTFKNSNRYYGRNSAGAYELSLEELRMQFGERRSIEERTKTFVNRRFLQVQANDGALPLPVEEGVMVMHLVPLPDFGAGRRHDIATLRDQGAPFNPIGTNASSERINLDGFLRYRGGDVCHGYTQVFRDGSIEATSASVFHDGERGRFFPSIELPLKIIKSLSSYMKGLKAIDASPPILLQISFFGTSGLQITLDDLRKYSDDPPAYTREDLHLPPTIIADYRDDNDYQDIVAEQMDSLWNVFGYERCFYFNEEGKWIGK